MQLINIKIPNTHTHAHTKKNSQKQLHIFPGLRHSLSEIKIPHHGEDSITTY